MSSVYSGKPYEKKKIPVLSFLWYKIKYLFRTKILRKHDPKEDKSKDDKRKSRRFNLNIDPKLSFFHPYNIIGHILQWYELPLIIGIVLSFMVGYSYKMIAVWLTSRGIPGIVDIVVLLVAILCLFPIGVLVAFLQAFDLKYDVIGDGQHLLDDDDVMSVAEQLAWSTASPEIEDAFWVSDLLQELWPYVNTFLIRMVSILCPNCSLTPLLGRINLISKLEVEKVYIGDNVPKITGIHIIKRGARREDMIIECELTYDADINIEIKGAYQIEAGINWFYFKGKFRIILTPLFRDLPVLGNIEMTLIDKPTINWRFTGVLKVLNWHLIKDIAKSLIIYFLLSWHKISFKLARKVPKSDIKLREPKGLLRIEVMSAANLPAMDTRPVIGCIPGCGGKSDPYCIVKVEDQEMWTHVIANELNPEWNREFCFLVHESLEALISMNVWDEDMIEDDFIGKFEIPIEAFIENTELNGQEVTVTLVDKEDKPLKLKSTLSFRVSWFKLSTNIGNLETTAGQSRTQLPVAALSVLVDSASGLETCTHQVRSPELRPLVKISVGNQIRITSIKRRTGYPVWEELHHFVLYSPKLESIYIEVIDMYGVEEQQLIPIIPLKVGTLGKFADLVGLSSKGTVLGYYRVSTVEILTSHRMKIEGSYRLQGYVEEAYIRLLMAIRIAQFESNVAENVRKPRTLLTDILKTDESDVEDVDEDYDDFLHRSNKDFNN